VGFSLPLAVPWKIPREKKSYKIIFPIGRKIPRAIINACFRYPVRYMAAMDKQPICGIRHCILKAIMAGIVCFENWKYLVQTKFQNPFRKSGNDLHEYSWTYMNPLNIFILPWNFKDSWIKCYIHKNKAICKYLQFSFKQRWIIHENSWMFISLENILISIILK
jgi:hypothetical protein